MVVGARWLGSRTRYLMLKNVAFSFLGVFTARGCDSAVVAKAVCLSVCLSVFVTSLSSVEKDEEIELSFGAGVSFHPFYAVHEEIRVSQNTGTLEITYDTRCYINGRWGVERATFKLRVQRLTIMVRSHTRCALVRALRW